MKEVVSDCHGWEEIFLARTVGGKLNKNNVDVLVLLGEIQSVAA
jgi:predicted phosphodiesterase